jgi:hypothetical protein
MLSFNTLKKETIMAKAKKKPSIREFVSEDSLKFQLYLLKLSNQLKNIEEKTTEEIIEKWTYDTQKKINRFTAEAQKPQYKNDDIAKDAFAANIIYLKNLPAPTTKEYVQGIFEIKRAEYIDSLMKRINENATATLKQDEELLEYAKAVQLTSNISKEKFGQMLLLMIKNIATMPSFSGYSDNWKTDFFSNAIEKTLLYLDNFDEELLSKRSGDKSKAFAYVTQICFNAFVNIINIRKKEDTFLKDTISLETANLDGMKKYSKGQQEDILLESKIEEETITSVYTKTIKKIEDLNQAIIDGVNHINSSNEILISNSENAQEIKSIEEDTPLDEKTEDYYDYLNDLKSKLIPEMEDHLIKVLRIIKPKDTSLGDFKVPKDILGDILLVIEEKKSKAKSKQKKMIDMMKEESEAVIQGELDEFDSEW